MGVGFRKEEGLEGGAAGTLPPKLRTLLAQAHAFHLAFTARGLRCRVLEKPLTLLAQAHAFHLAFTAVVGLAAYQAVIAVARNSEGFDFWGGVLMCGANAALLIPMLAVPLIFGGMRSRRLRDLSPPQVLPPLLCARGEKRVSSYHAAQMKVQLARCSSPCL